MEGHLDFNRSIMAYPSKLNSKISQDISQLRDSSVNANRLFILSRYVNQCKNRNSAFPFTQNPYEYITNPENLSITVNLLQFVQNSSFFLSYLQENPKIFALVTISIRRSWQYPYLVNCVIPSFFGFFSCHEYAEYAIEFYSEILGKAAPATSIQTIRPFFHSCVTYHFFQNAFQPFIQSIMVDENILKNPDKQVSVYAHLFIDYITNSIQFLPKEFFQLLRIIELKKWDYKFKISLIIDNFLFPELKIWASRLSLNKELNNFILRIIDMISLSTSLSYGKKYFNDNKLSSLSSSPTLFKSMNYMTDSSSSFNLMSIDLEPEVPSSPSMPISRSTSTLKSTKTKSQKISNESKTTIMLMNKFIDLLFDSTIEKVSIYQMPVLYENFADEIFPQCAQFILNVYDVRFVSKLLERNHQFPNKVSSFVFLNDSLECYESGIFYSHVYSHHISFKKNESYFSLFKSEVNFEERKKTPKFNISLIDNDIFVHFLRINKHYAQIFSSIIKETKRNSIFEQNENIEKYIYFLTLINEIEKENDRILYQTSFELDAFADSLLNRIIFFQTNSPKKKSFIKLFKKVSNVFNKFNLIQMKKNLYLKILDHFHKDLIGDYWRVLVDFNKYWEELVNEPKEKKNLVTVFSSMDPILQIFFIDSTKLLSQIDDKVLDVKYYLMTYAFRLLKHIAQGDSNGNEIYKLAFQHIKATDLLSTFLIIDSMAMKVDVFQELCTKEEIESWNYLKKNIEIYLNRNEQYKKVYMSITEYLIAITPSLLYSPPC